MTRRYAVVIRDRFAIALLSEPLLWRPSGRLDIVMCIFGLAADVARVRELLLA